MSKTMTAQHTRANNAANDSLGALGRMTSGLIANIRRASANRSMRRELASMDDVLLRDIGIGEDEIHRIRAMERFTPRSWA